MFEKESQDYAMREVASRQELYIKGRADIDADYEKVKKIWQDGAEFGYNKGFEFGVKSNEKVNQIVDNEWHYVKDGDFPTDRTEKKYLVALKSEYSGFFYETDIWCESLHCFASNNPTKVYAWKEIILPKFPKESE
jgi:hypothetical protein